MIYARRALQCRLDEIRPILSAEASKALANRVNRPGRDRIAAMWEFVIPHALAKLGTLTLEAPSEHKHNRFPIRDFNDG